MSHSNDDDGDGDDDDDDDDDDDIKCCCCCDLRSDDCWCNEWEEEVEVLCREAEVEDEEEAM